MKIFTIIIVWMNMIATLTGAYTLFNDPKAYGMYFAIVLAFLVNAWIINSSINHHIKYYGSTKNGKNDTGRRTPN